MGKPDLKVIECHIQEPVQRLLTRSARLDALVSDSQSQIYDVEVQRTDGGASPKRSRFNSSLLDASLLEKGQDFEKLPETYVIFITENDVLGGNKPVYHIDRYIREEGRLFGDGAHIIYVNGSWKDESTPLGRLIHDFRCTDPDQMYSSVLAGKMRFYKETPKGVGAMCKIMRDLMDEFRDEIREEVKSEVREEVKNEVRDELRTEVQNEVKNEVRDEERTKMVRGLVMDGTLPLKKISEITGMLLEEVQKLQAGLAAGTESGGKPA